MPTAPLNLSMHFEVPDAVNPKTEITIQDDQGNILGTTKYLIAKIASDTGEVVAYAVPGGDLYQTVEAALAAVENQYRDEFMAGGG